MRTRSAIAAFYFFRPLDRYGDEVNKDLANRPISQLSNHVDYDEGLSRYRNPTSDSPTHGYINPITGMVC